MNKAIKKNTALIIAVMVFMISGTTVFAGATTSGSINYGSKYYSCTGALTYSGASSSKILKATINCSLDSASISTEIRGRFTRNGEFLPWQEKNWYNISPDNFCCGNWLLRSIWNT